MLELHYPYLVLFICASGFMCFKCISTHYVSRPTLTTPHLGVEWNSTLLVQLNQTSETFYHKQGECIICIDDYGEEEIRMLPCLHTFHKKCIDRWITTSHRMECPICSMSLV